MKYNKETLNKIDVRIFTTISGRVLICELINVSDIGVELLNVFLIDPSYPEGMVPIHQDSVMNETIITLYDKIIETETTVSKSTESNYIQHCLGNVLKDIESNFPKKINKKNKETINGDTLFNWRNKFN